MTGEQPRIAILGASSVSLGPQIINDILSEPSLNHAMITLMAPHESRLRVVERWARRAAEHESLGVTIRATTDRRVALAGADYVITLFDGGGFEAFDADYRIACSFGLDICIGDTMGPTGIMKGLRNIKTLMDLTEDYSELCPDALLLNYVNPMAPVVMAAEAVGFRTCVGLCGGIEATRELIATCLQMNLDDLQTSFAGINHMCWALRIGHDGQDMYARFREKMACPEWRAAEPTRSDVLHHFGFFPTESSGHLSDMLPWFRKDVATRARYGSAPGYAGTSGIYHRFMSYLHNRLDDEDYLRFEQGFLGPRSRDYGASIIAAVHTGIPFYAYGNVSNVSGAIPNLPTRACVEVPIVADDNGVQSLDAGPLPAQLAALCKTNCIVHELLVEASMQGDAELVVAALSLDPMTQSVLDLTQIRKLTLELMEVNKCFVPASLGRIPAKSVFAGSDVQQPSAVSLLPNYGPLKILRRFDVNRRRERSTRS